MRVLVAGLAVLLAVVTAARADQCKSAEMFVAMTNFDGNCKAFRLTAQGRQWRALLMQKVPLSCVSTGKAAVHAGLVKFMDAAENDPKQAVRLWCAAHAATFNVLGRELGWTLAEKR